MDQDPAYVFESGLPGFVELRRYRLEPGEWPPFEWLVAVDDPSVRFVVVNPMVFRKDYAPRITKEQLNALGVFKKEHLRLLVIVTVASDFARSTANLAGPLLFNTKDLAGMQVLLDDGAYGVQEPILQNLAKGGN
jgi:flagellar assembly factor FliW